MKPVVLLDVDGVIANFVDAFLTVTNSLLGTAFVHDDVTDWDIGKSLHLTPSTEARVYGECAAEGFARLLKPYPDAIEGVRALTDVAEIYFVTSPLEGSPTWTHDREWWLNHYLGYPRSRVIHAKSKHLVSGDVFVDDNDKNVHAWAKCNPTDYAVLWPQPYNRADRGFRWAQLVDLAREIVR